jgi:tripeptidyl-peptidase-1
MRLSLLPLFLLCSLATATPMATARDHTLQVKESVPAPHDWVKLRRAPADHSIRLRIALYQQDFSGLEVLLYQISDPNHRRYGAHMSKEEVEKFVAPHPGSLALVDEWLAAHGIQENDLSRSPSKDWVSVTLPIRLAEQIMGAVCSSESFFIAVSF